MRTKLLKKARRDMDIIQHKQTKLYRFRYGGYKLLGASAYAYRYDSGWTGDLDFLRHEKRIHIKARAKEIFENALFKRERPRTRIIN